MEVLILKLLILIKELIALAVSKLLVLELRLVTGLLFLKMNLKLLLI